MSGPLSELTVVDLSRVLTGPYASMMLGDLGADVIKIERPESGDQTRGWGPPNIGQESAYYLSANRNKRSITLNLKKAEGKQVFLDLVEQADVILENFRPGVLEDLNLGYDRLQTVNPKVILCSITGYGQTGPWKNRPAYDIIMQAEGGYMGITGEENGAPVRIGVALVDIIAGIYAAQSILAAVIDRAKTGKGQQLDISMYDCELSTLTYMAQFYFATGNSPGRMGSKHPSIVPYQAFETKDDYVVVGVANEAIWTRFCKAIDQSELTEDPRFETNNNRVENRSELEEILRPIFKSRQTQYWVKTLKDYEVPATSVKSMDEIFDSPQARARDMVQEINHPAIGSFRTLGIPVKFGQSTPEIKQHPPMLGEHTEEVLEDLGYTENELKRLSDQGVI